MAMSKKKGAINKYSGGKLLLLELTSGALAGTEVAGDWIDLGYVESSELMDETPEETFADETGNTVDTDYGDRTVKYSGNLMQSDKDLLDFLKETVRGKYYSLYHYQGVVNSKDQEIVAAVCTVKPIVQLASGTKRPPFEINILKNDSAFAYGGVGEAALPTDAKASTASVAADKYYTILETAVS